MKITLLFVYGILLILGGVIGYFVYRLIANKQIGSAKQEAARIKEEASNEAKTLRKEALLEAKEEQHRIRNDLDKELRERRGEIQKIIIFRNILK